MSIVLVMIKNMSSVKLNQSFFKETHRRAFKLFTFLIVHTLRFLIAMQRCIVTETGGIKMFNFLQKRAACRWKTPEVQRRANSQQFGWRCSV